MKVILIKVAGNFMLMFHNDYNQMCHPKVLEWVIAASQSQLPGYGTDDHCRRAADLIRQHCGNQSLAVHFLVGGTQANLTVIAASLRPHQAVIGAESAHINVHETGAIEATGHKVILLPEHEGKISPQDVERVVLSQSLSMDAEHIAQPKMVYISNPTEFGTVYTLTDLEALSAICRKHGLYLYVDGARMGYGLAAADNDVTLKDLSRLCDVFYIGGTKMGAMFGEAVVIANPHIAEDFRYLMKQRGGMMAKGWLLGLQFEALFQDELYFQIGASADEQADLIRQTLKSLGYALVAPSRTNQVFVTLPDMLLDALGKEFTFAVWDKPETGYTTVRFCTSWATQRAHTDALCARLVELSK